MGKITVGVLRGGPSSEYDVSLKTGANVLNYLPADKYKAVDIFISKSGEWHLKGKAVAPHKVFPVVDVIFNAMHGEYGEDGEVQKILDTYNIPYTGSKKLASRIAMRKDLARDIVQKIGIKVAPALIIKKGEDVEEAAHNAFIKVGPPFIVKAAARGSSVGIIFANNIPELSRPINEILKYDKVLLVEKRIKGREATCGVLEKFRGEKLYAMPTVEIIPPKDRPFFDYEAKYSGLTQEICPGRFNEKEKKEIQKIARAAHEALGCRHYSRTDIMVAKDGMWYLETNTLPGLTAESLFPKSANAIGCSLAQLLNHLITLALDRNN